MERLLQQFESRILDPDTSQAVKECKDMFQGWALALVEITSSGPERTVALRKLLESRDAAVRAIVRPGV